MNRYGTIKQRLTNNAYFEGELAVSPDFQRVIFASNRNGDYDLYLADLNDMDNPKRLTNTLGYEGGVQFAPDGRSIAFLAWRPQSPEAQECYRWLTSYNFTDVERFDVYLLDLESGEERKVTDFAARLDESELNATWTTPYFAFAPNADLYVKHDTQFYHVNPAAAAATPIELKFFPNDNLFEAFQLRNDTIVAFTGSADVYQIVRGKYNFSATYDIHIPQILSVSSLRTN
ncbi:hypothetical protein M3Y99_01050500 [Aphelenchoides fujianensis]|nr:hypothetical protein M3Y99_01050500 [Aphelenchoides fujianensis]